MGKRTEPAKKVVEEEKREQPSVPPTLMTIKDVANHLKVSRSTIHRMCEAGQIPFVEVRGRRRFDILAVMAALSRHR